MRRLARLIVQLFVLTCAAGVGAAVIVAVGVLF